jgi:uncharacterized protein with ParB-like and HNH nuclease domain
MNEEPINCETGVTVSEMLELNLQIPDYQRPYKWKEKNVSELFYDIKEAMEKRIDVYRIGTIILHTEENSGNIKYSIVDGQQRIISLNLLLNILGQPIKLDVFDDSAGITKRHVQRNSKKFEKLVKSLTPEIKRNYISYLKEKCEFVKITTWSQDKAFQFFDSQNNRGKELELYDILKAYHLREINSKVSTNEKHEIVNRWENAEPELRCLFNDYLYQIKQWSKSKNGNRSKWKMDDIDSFFEIFKGIKNSSDDMHAKYHVSANREFRQIDMPIISGQSFFYDIFYYLSMQKDIEELCKQKFSEKLKKFNNTGDKYIYDMMKCALLFIAIKFGVDTIEQNVLGIRDKIFIWAWSLKLRYQRIYKETINNYAIGNNERLRINNNLEIFATISDATSKKQLSEIDLQQPLSDKISDLSEFIDKLFRGDINA